MVSTIFLRFKGDPTSAVRAGILTRNSINGVSSAGARLGRILSTGVVVGTAAFAYGMGKALSVAGNFEQGLNTFQAVSEATGDQMARVSRLSKQLGADLTLPATSAKDAADTMTELAKGGLSVRDSMNAARGAIQLSTAAQIENAEAATIVADALNAFGLRGRDSTRVADLLAAAANATTAEIGDMAAALKQSSAVAAQLDIPIKETVTLLGELANAGIKGSDAGTSLRTMLLRLGAPTKKAKDVMEDLGVSVFDARGQMLPMPKIIDQFAKATKGMSDEQRSAAFLTIFGTDAIRAANVVLRGGRKAHDDMAKAVGRQGAAAKLAEARTRGYKGALDGFKSTVETFAITLGAKLLPVATDVVRKLSEMVGFLDRVVSASSPTIALKILFTGVRGAVGNLVDGIREALTGTGGFKPLKLKSGKIIEFEDQRHPALVTRLMDALENADWSGVGKRIGTAIGSAIVFSADALDSILGGIVGWVADHAGEIAEVGATIIAEMFVKILDPAFWVEHWRLALSVAFAALGLMFTPAKFAKSGILLRALSGLFIGIPRAIGRFIARIGADFFRGIGSTAAGAAARGASRLVTRVLTFFRQLPARVERYIAITADAIGRQVGEWAGAGGRLGLALIRGVVNAARNLPGRVDRILGRIPSRIASFIGDVFAAAYTLGKAVLEGILSGLVGLFTAVKNKLVGGIKDAINYAKGHLGSTAEQYASVQLGQPIAQGIANGIAAGEPVLAAALRKSIRGAISRAGFERFSQIAQQLFSGRQGSVTTAAEREIAAIERRREVEALQQALREATDPTARAQAQEDIRLFELREQAQRERAQLEARQFLASLRFQSALERLSRQIESGNLTAAQERRRTRRFVHQFNLSISGNLSRADKAELAKQLSPYIGQAVAYTVEAH